MARYIDADEAIAEINRISQEDYICYDDKTGEELITKNLAVRAIEQSQTADVEEVRHGKWSVCGRLEGKTVMQCSLCRQGIIQRYAPEYYYCPNCGAKMDGGKSK